MADDGIDSAALLEPPRASQPPPESTNQSSRPPPLSPEHSRESVDYFEGWKNIGEQQDFYDEQDCLHPSHNNLASEKLNTRRDDHIVIFDYSLNPDYLNRADGNPFEEGSPSSEHFSADDDIFFQVSKNELIESKQFDQIINITKEPPLIPSRGQRLGIIDFPQCYHTYDDRLLNSMAEKLGLKKKDEAAFMGGYLKRVRDLPGREGFRTGISLRASFKKPSDSSKSGLPESPKSGSSRVSRPGSSEDRFILFVSFPYFGRSSEKITLGPTSESVKLLDFKRLGVDVPDRKPGVIEEERDYIRDMSVEQEGISVEEGEILVHQAQYMLFDNNTMAIFRSKEDGTKDQVPLHRFQERVGAFRAMIHMIANRTELELRALRKLQVSLCKLEEDIDRMISDADLNKDDQAAKQKRVQDLLVALNRLSADFFAAISVAERQIAVLQDLHSVFLTSYRTKTKDYEKGYPLRRNPFYRNVVPIPILLENPEQIWPNTLDTIDEVVRERESFIKKVGKLVENMDIRRKILSAFLKSDQAKAAPSEQTAQKTEKAIASVEAAIKETQASLVQQVQTLSGFTLVTTAFLPLGFCTSYYGMNNIKEFDNAPMSKRDFWLATFPVLVGILLLTAIIILWKRPYIIELRSRCGVFITTKWREVRREIGDLEKGSNARDPQGPTNDSPDSPGPPHTPGGSPVTTAGGASTALPQTSRDQILPSE
ncbi:hypothetical protein B9Z19DRAFT_1190011 [Tuber borchii]|uniref:Cora-like Mg2+ transporter protein-domain-containing protein n=1 Tax=Tuber borchii TaxID=42251 RepID=A0A2T7A5G9_TUBBO|nr:hypothetical protein B9Z19DRAFT_1190011 [Tuber borchii]